jgi:hypothetical protein
MSDRPPHPEAPRPGSDRLDDLLRQARDASARVGSVLPAVERRIASASIKPRVPVLRWAVAAAVFLASGIGTAIWVSQGARPKPPSDRAAVVPPLAESFRMEVGGVEVVEHASAMIDGRAVAVVWSCRGGGATAEQLRAAAEGRRGKYQGRLLHRQELPAGRTLLCSVFLADAGVRPVLEPPIVRMPSAAGGVLAFSASPRQCSPEGLARVLQGSGVSPDDVLREVRRQTQ